MTNGWHESMRIEVANLSALLEQSAEPMRLRNAGISEHTVFAPAGSYQRRPPDHLDTAQATPRTRETLDLYARVLQQDHGAIHLASIEHAILVGQGTVVTRNGLLLRESALEMLAQGQSPPGLIHTAPNAWRLREPPRTHIGSPALLMKRPWYRNYGHCIVEFATALAVMSEHMRASNWKIVIGAAESPVMRRIVFELITILCPGTPILEHRDDETWLFSDLRYLTPLHVPPLFKWPPGLTALRQALLRETVAPTDQPRRLFLSRRDAADRRLTNEPEVSACLQQHGFQPVALNGLRVAEQAALFSNAEAVIGVKGAALANIVFCQPGCRIMILSPGDFADPFFWDIAGQRDMPYAELFGTAATQRPDSHNDFSVDIPSLQRMLAAMLPF